MKPLIGIVAYSRVLEHNCERYDISYGRNSEAIEKAGGLPVLIPRGLDPETLRAIYERVDAVFLTGGGDIKPDYYEAEPHVATDEIDDARDRTEITITRWAVEDDRPMFGICRGVQVMNVALGGTLVQDIPSLVETELRHHSPAGIPRNRLAHQIHIHSDSRLAEIMGTTVVTVNSLHHQSIDQPGSAVHVTAHAPDGVIEAMELPDKRFALGVQWHPEDMEDDEQMQLLFNAFVDSARQWMNGH